MSKLPEILRALLKRRATEAKQPRPAGEASNVRTFSNYGETELERELRRRLEEDVFTLLEFYRKKTGREIVFVSTIRAPGENDALELRRVDIITTAQPVGL